MAITVITVPDCPHAGLALERVVTALAQLGRSDEINEQVVASAEEAERLRFGGSPTILVDGVDPFPGPQSAGMTCRLYATEDGLEGAPSIEQLTAVLCAP